MVLWKTQAQKQVTVTHSGTDYDISQKTETGSIRRIENGFDTATILLQDPNSELYKDCVAAGDAIKFEQKDASDSTWTTILNGVIRRVDPIFTKASGQQLVLECDGAGYGLHETICGEEYGSESIHPTLDCIKEMIDDATYGIIPKWVNELLGTGVPTGYNYSTQIRATWGTLPEIKYVYLPFKPVDRAINDLCDIVQGARGTNKGPHWIVATDNSFLMDGVGDHAAPVTTWWTTYWREATPLADRTLTEGVDFPNFAFQHLAKEANYVLYHGAFQKPGDGDYLTENAKAPTDVWGKSAATTLAYDNGAGNFKVALYSLKGSAAHPDGVSFWYPKTDADWTVNNWGGQHNIPTLNFWLMRDANVTAIIIYLVYDEGAGKWFRKSILPTANTWTHYTWKIGDYSDEWEPVLSPSWSSIDKIWITATPNVATTANIWVDGLNFNGWILRGARTAAAFSASNPAKMKIINDNVAKDDYGKAATDTGMIARLAYAELLRCQTTPIVGSFIIPIANDLLPGQLVHIHAKEKADASLSINYYFRVTKVTHAISKQGFFSQVEVTDDVTNSRPRPIPTNLNALLGAVRPEFQDRQATSIKTREIDITQNILEKPY